MMRSAFVYLSLLLFTTVLGGELSAQKKKKPLPSNQSVPSREVSFWLTKADSSVLLQKQNTSLKFAAGTNDHPSITIDAAQAFQTIDGFGYSLTDGSAYWINHLPKKEREDLLQELFGSGGNSIRISYLRLTIGASDLSASVYTYDDMPAGQTDEKLEHFNLATDKTEVIPVMKQILAINPRIKILGSPWTPPVWMKDNGSAIGGSLKPEYYDVYARYFVRYIKEMKAQGITIDALTVQNEPLHPKNNPSMYMTAEQQNIFIKNHLGPAFKAAGIKTKIQVYDHNCDRPDYPLTILNDPETRKYVDGSAFHLYAGDISALSEVHKAYPDKHLYLTEQYTSSQGKFGEDLIWHMKNVIIGAMRNWSRNALEWNLANDPGFNPHTSDGGCTTCKGALTINGGINRNVSYYIIGHASKFVLPGSVRIGSDNTGNLLNVAFKRPDGKIVLIVANDGTNNQSFNIRFNNKQVTTSLDAGSIATYIW